MRLGGQLLLLQYATHRRSTRVTSPKRAKQLFFIVYSFDIFGARDPFQGLLQALTSNFPSKMCDLDAYLPSYATFRRFRRFWKVANPFLRIWCSFGYFLAALAAEN